LVALFAAAGLGRVREVTIENPITTVEDKMFRAELADSMRDAMIATKGSRRVARACSVEFT
jgi:hypothetical protein